MGRFRPWCVGGVEACRTASSGRCASTASHSTPCGMPAVGHVTTVHCNLDERDGELGTRACSVN